MLKNFIKFILGFIFFLIIQFCKLFMNIRIGKFPSTRIGPFITSVEIVAAKKKELNIRSLDIWSHNKAKEPNEFLSKIVSREINFINHCVYNFIEYFFNVIKVKKYKKFFFLVPSTRDNMNLFDKYPNVLKFKDDEIDYAKKILKKNKVDLSKKIVCLNVRDSAYLKDLFPDKDMSYHDRRDAEVNDYKDVIKYLVSKNYVVIRMGKKMKHEVNFKHENFIDYPFASFKEDILDIYFGYICDFTISTGSGWDSVPFCFRKPILYTNMSSISKIQLSSKRFMTTFKLAKNKKGNLMKINELLLNDLKLISNIYSDNNNLFSDISFINNSPEELLESTKEFLNYLIGYTLSPSQKKFQEKFFDNYDPLLVRDIYGEQAHSANIKGVISSTFLEKYEKDLF
tara:strand:- start:3106 stop:4299 length:1194 start_codon:yes stop_codon:yes gene_type:complete